MAVRAWIGTIARHDDDAFDQSGDAIDGSGGGGLDRRASKYSRRIIRFAPAGWSVR
jgi:hypothetical protein